MLIEIGQKSPRNSKFRGLKKVGSVGAILPARYTFWLQQCDG